MHWRTAERAEALRLVAAGDARGIEMLREAEVIQADGTLRGAAAAVALHYLTDGWGDKIALAWSRAEADLLTRAIRAGLDELHAGRAGFEPETGGAFAGLKPGDRIRFIFRTAAISVSARSHFSNDQFVLPRDCADCSRF